MPGIHQFFVIGIDEYSHYKYPKLNNAKGDAERLKKVLSERYGFVEAAPPLFNFDATREAIDDSLNGLYSSVSEDDSLIIYFAGHGEMNQVNSKGYWVPVDVNDRQSSLIKNSTVLDLIENIKCKHILLISDSCFSGSLLGLSRAAEITDHEILESRASRWIITSGGLATVLDGVVGRGSPFSRALCEVLETNALPSVSINELFEEVFRLTEPRRQTPLKGFMAIEDHKDGQMIFRLSQSLSTGEDGILIEKIDFPIPPINEPDFHINRSLTFHEPQSPPEAWFYEPLIGRVYLEEIVQTTHRVVILGGAGSGKSNELRNLAFRLKQPEKIYVPILKKFNTYTDENIEDFLPEDWNQVYLPALVLLFDGLDEIQPQFFITAVRKLSAFADKYPQVRIVVTCRTNFYELPDKEFGGTLNGFSTYMLNDLNLSDIQKYADKVLQHDGEDFVQEINDSGVKDLVQKPFFLQVLVKFFVNNTISGGSRGAIIKDALAEYLLNNKRHFHLTGIDISQNQLLIYLERIAFIMELTGKNFIKDAELRQVFRKNSDYDYCKYLPAFQLDEEKGQWMFEHNNIQEYLASKVLARQPFEKLIDILSIKSAGESKIKPTWVNTLSFLINTEETAEIDALLEWIIENDREIIVRFEPDRVTFDKRVKIFKQIFEFYSARQIWLYSNKFSHKELARFGHSEESLNLLLDILRSDASTRIDKINAMHLLMHFEISYFPAALDDIRNLLIGLLNEPDLVPSDIYTVLGVLAELDYADQYLIDTVLKHYGLRKNQYLRAGIYKLIIAAELANDYVEILLDGMEFCSFGFTDPDRDSVSLMDESFLLKIALEKINRTDALIKMFVKMTTGISRLMFTSDFNEIVETFLNHAFLAYAKDKELFEHIALFFGKEAGDHRKKYVTQILEFFNQNQLNTDVLQFILSDERFSEYELYEAITLLIDDVTISWLVSGFEEKRITGDEIEKIYKNFVWRGRYTDGYSEKLQKFENAFNLQTELLLVRPEVIDWVKINKEKAQRSFDILFDEEAFRIEVERLLKHINADPIGIDDLYPSTNFTGDDLEDSFASSAIGLIREFTFRGSQVTQAALKEWMATGDNLLNYRIQTIHDRIVNLPELNIKEDQSKFIHYWATKKGNNRTILWHFIQRFDIELSEEILLSFTLYFDSSAESEINKSGTIEKLEAYLSKKKIKDRVAQNLSNGINNLLVWTSNAGYALRNRLSISYENILGYLEAAHEQEYRFDSILKMWFKQSKDSERLRRFITTTESPDLRSQAIKLLVESGKEKLFLLAFFKEILKNTDAELFEKLEASNYLIGLNDVDGFNFITAYILEHPDPNFEFRLHLTRFKNLTSTALIPQLLELLTISKQDQFKLDVFNDLETIILDAFANIGVQSEPNLIAVKESLENYVNEKQGIVKNVNFLHFTIEKIQEQFNLKKTEKFTTNEAIALFDSL